MPRCFLFLIPMLLTGCMTYKVKVDYKGSGVKAKDVKTSISKVIVNDKRDSENDWFGARRTGFGNRVSTLRTEVSTDQAVAEVYRSALERSGILNESATNAYTMSINILQLNCNYILNIRGDYVAEVSLVKKGSSPTFTKTYASHEEIFGGAALGFADLDLLREVGEVAINKAVDKTLHDPEFLDALADTNIDATESKLQKLKELYQKGLISDDEFKRKKSEILSEM